MRKVVIFFLSLLAINGSAQNQNPILAGDYPDPSILRDGDTYYLVNSSFEYYPGLLVWQSKDLVNWVPAGNALHKYVGSVYAPDLVKYKNKFYIYFPANNTNFVVTADSINGRWSDPVDLKIGGIDPGHFVDTNNKRYLYFSNGGYAPLSDDGLAITGDLSHVYNGWAFPREWSVECFCLEGPKITRRGNYYYLTVAEGGTAGPATSHMIVSARSKSPFGPWENSPYNPIERTLDKSEKWWSKGHGTLFEDVKGGWWMVFHAYENGYHNMGRQTLLAPVEWTNDGWFRVPKGVKTAGPAGGIPGVPKAAAFSLNDDLGGLALRPHWKFFGGEDTARYHFVDGWLVIKAKGRSVSDCSPLLCIPSSHSYTAQVELSIEGNATAGLVLFYNNTSCSGILADSAGVAADLRGWQTPPEKMGLKGHVFLRLRNIDNTVDMFYSSDGVQWHKIESSLEVSGMNHNALGGFLSLRIGLCSMGDGAVRFRNFRYKTIK